MSKVTITIEDTPDGGIVVSANSEPPKVPGTPNTPAEILADGIVTAVIKEIGGEPIEINESHN